jgi:Uma2 family endonuclease
MPIAPAFPVSSDVLRLIEDDGALELIDGVVVERPATLSTSHVGAWITWVVGDFVARYDLGHVYSSGLGIRIFATRPDTILKARVSFLRADRVPPGDSQFLTVPPDLVVEVVSPSDLFEAVRQKVDLWLDAGVQAVWVALPNSRELHVYEAGAHPRLLTADDELDAGATVPGFRVPVRDLFPPAR